MIDWKFCKPIRFGDELFSFELRIVLRHWKKNQTTVMIKRSYDKRYLIAKATKTQVFEVCMCFEWIAQVKCPQPPYRFKKRHLFVVVLVIAGEIQLNFASFFLIWFVLVKILTHFKFILYFQNECLQHFFHLILISLFLLHLN